MRLTDKHQAWNNDVMLRSIKKDNIEDWLVFNGTFGTNSLYHAVSAQDIIIIIIIKRIYIAQSR